MVFQRFYRSAVVAAATLALPLAPLAAQQATLPAARDLIARYITAIGGRDAIMAKRSVRARGTFEMPAMGVRGDFDMARSREGAVMTKIVLPGLGEIQGGFDGTTAWALNPMVGPRVLDGNEAAQLRDEASATAVFREPPAVTTAETVELTSMGGEACYKVRITWASGRRSHDCYSAESGLLVATQISQESPMGTLDVMTLIRDYKDFGGVKMATTTTVSAAGQEQVIRVASYGFDDLDPTIFALPAAITALVQQRASPTR